MQIHNVFGRALITLPYFFALAYGVAKLIDPVKTRKWELKYWWRIRPGSILPKYLDLEELERSPRRQIQERLGAAVFVGFLLLVGFSAVNMIWAHGNPPR
jgi:hypothetical protein